MKKLLPFVFFALLAAPLGFIHAQTPAFTPPSGGINSNVFCQGGSCTYVPLEPLPFFGDNQRYGPNSGSIGSWVKNAYQLLIGAGAILAVAMIVAGALTYMFSDVVGNKTKAIARIRNAMWGLVILVSSYLILVTINPELTTFNLNLKVHNNYDTSPTPARPASTKLTVSDPNTFQVYNGENAPTEIARLQDQCKSPKSLNQIGEEADTHGTYTVWKCQ